MEVASSNLSTAFFFFPCFGNRGCPLTSKPSLIGLHGLNAIGIDNFLAWVCQLAVLEGWGDNSIGALCTCVYVCAEETELQGSVIALHSRSNAVALIERVFQVFWLGQTHLSYLEILISCWRQERRGRAGASLPAFSSLMDDLILSFSLRNAGANPLVLGCSSVQWELKGDNHFGVIPISHSLCSSTWQSWAALKLKGQPDISLFSSLTEETEEWNRLSNFSCQRDKNRLYIHRRQETNTSSGSSLWLRLYCLKSITWNLEMVKLC